MRQYVTSILVAVSQNTAVPLAFAFGPAEALELYEQFYTGFAARGIDLSAFTVESDQGPALIAYCKRHRITQRFCLHHFLRRLKDPDFAVYVGDLVRARTPQELHLLAGRYSDRLRGLMGELEGDVRTDHFRRARKEFKKAGLAVSDTCDISIADLGRWQQVSMLTRVRERLPPTTNCLESIHGHLNESTPRNNTFWASMCRLGAQMARSLEGFSLAVRHNFNHACRKAQDMATMLLKDGPERTAQLAYFQSSIGQCSCGQTVHLSFMYGMDIPCAHRLVRGENRVKIDPLPQLVMAANTDRLNVDFKFNTDPVPPHDNERQGYLMELAMNNIRRSSHTRKSKKIVMEWVVANYPQEIGHEFALGLPMSILELILAGVALFAL
jgi:hypothetical protein